MSGDLESSPQPIGGVTKRLRRPLAMGLTGSLLLWLAQPPVMWGWLGWVATVPWLLLVEREELGGRRAYGALWLASLAYWAAALWWVCLPHPATKFGLPFLAGYLALYLPLFVAISRVGVHRLRAPLWLVAPIVWTGLELAQAHLLSGFLMAELSHTQVWYPSVVQIAAWTGAYGVSFVLVMVASGLVAGARQWSESQNEAIAPIASRAPVAFFAAALPVALVLFVGHYALQQAEQLPTDNAPTIALIQGDTRATWDPDPERSPRIMRRQQALSQRAVRLAKESGKELDLIVWPESMFRTPVVTFRDALTPPPEVTSEAVIRGAQAAPADFEALASELRTPMLLGVDRYYYEGPFDADPAEWKIRLQNSAALVDADGQLVALYDKMHRVPFGEYIPLFDNMPALYFLTPMHGGIKPGDRPVAMPLAAFRGQSKPPLTISPNICYETVIPHVIHRQVRTLLKEGTPPDLLVNVTNNAWFWGSSELEMHLACNIYRAVETRTPLVIAANGGLSAAIDSSGRVLQLSERMSEQVLIAKVSLDPRKSFYTRNGDWFAGACLILTGVLAIIGFSPAIRRRRTRNSNTPPQA